MIQGYTDKALLKHAAVIDFYAPWCVPCQSITPIYGKISAQYALEVACYKVNVDENEEIAEQFAVVNLPTFVFLKDGEEVYRHSGAWTAQGMKDSLKEYFGVE